MTDSVFYIIITVVLLVAELVYFRVAERLKIIDKPNERSSHTKPTIRGAGIIFPFAVLVWAGVAQMWPFWVIGVVLIAIISFADDRKPVSSALRAAIHAVAILLLFYQAGIYDWPVVLIALAFVVSVGTLNAFNFMDGINGITGLYALVNIGTMFFVNRYVQAFTNESLLVILAIATFVFLYFNYRKAARCFAGDVGSVTLAFIQVFLLFQLMNATDELMWVGMFLVFGADSVITIIYRLIQKENIFKPHRQHVYQYLSNELKWSHRLVSALYAWVQLSLNASIVYAFTQRALWWYVPTLIVVYLIGFTLLRIQIKRRVNLATAHTIN